MSLQQSEIIQGFETIASKYDLANDIMTLGLHRLWRRQLIQSLGREHKKRTLSNILDLGTGTGDLAISIAKALPNVHVIAAEPAAAMLSFAKQKAANILPASDNQRIQWIHCDLDHLRLPEASLDAITMAWVIRNIQDTTSALMKLRTLLRPQGTIHILESGRPCTTLMKTLYPIYSRLFPYLGSIISPQKDFYEYYRRSVDAFPYHQQFVALLQDCGYLHTQSTPLLGGVVYLYTAKAHA